MTERLGGTADCAAVINVNWIYLGTAIGALGTAVYLRDTLRGTTQPNRVTWLLWAVAPLLAAAVELNDGVGLRALPTFMVGFMPLLVFLGSFHNPASVWKIRRIDYACGAMSVVGTVVVAGDPQRRAGHLRRHRWPTSWPGCPPLMKSWTHPETETVYSYIGAVISMAILLLTIDRLDLRGGGLPDLHRVHGLGRGGPGRPRARPAALRRARLREAPSAERRLGRRRTPA